VLARPESFGFLDSLATRLTVPFTDSLRAMESEDWRSQTSSTVATQVNRARKSFYAHARNLRIGFGIMRCIQAFLERLGFKGLQWSADPRKEGGLCEAMVDVLRGKVGGDIKLLGMFTKSIILLSVSQRSILIVFHCNRKLNQLHGVLKELLTFFDASSQILSDEQEARATIALFQSLLFSDTYDKSNVELYSDVASRLSEWTKTFLT
jgi:origin recognition complex subunit 3